MCPAQMGASLPALVFAGVLSRGCCGVELNHLVPQPSLSSTILLLCPSAGERCCLSPLDTGTRVTSAALNSFATDTKAPLTFLQGQFRNQQQQDKDIPQLSVTHEKKTPKHNCYKNERTPTPMDFISLPFTSLTPVSVSGVSRGGAS